MWPDVHDGKIVCLILPAVAAGLDGKLLKINIDNYSSINN
jgi:hypothetical protein